MRSCHVVRVFTRGDEGGNHLGVVLDVTGLTAVAMQAVAEELGFSETIFVDGTAAEVPHVRIFTPTAELAFAGHPLVGAGWVLSDLGAETAAVTCGIGTVGFDHDGTRTWIDLPLDRPVKDPAPVSLTGLGLAPTAVSTVDMPLRYVVAELGRLADVADYVPPAALRSSVHPLAIWAPAGSDAVKLRFFAPSLGVLEDPATGSAAVALAATLRERGMESGRLIVRQGDEIGFPSEILLEWDGDRVRVGGTVRRDEVRRLSV